MTKIGIIGSTGIQIDLLTDRYAFESIEVGSQTFKFYHGYVGEKEIFLTARNQYRGSVPPHEVDSRLIIKGMKQLGVDVILGTAVAGSLTTDIQPGTYLVLDQFLDFTRKTPNTIYEPGAFAFVDFAEPYCPYTRKLLIQACEQVGVTYLPKGCYVGIDGPRYETSAETRMYRLLGGDVVGMTNVPETIYSRELGMCYAALSVISDLAAGLSPKKSVIRQDCYDVTMASLSNTISIIKTFINLYTAEKDCDCSTKNSDMLQSES